RRDDGRHADPGDELHPQGRDGGPDLMTTLTEHTTTGSASTTAAPRRPRRRGPRAYLREHLLLVVTVAVFVFMLLPNAVILWMSFNQPQGKFDYVWHRFSLDAWRNPCASHEMCHSIGLSLEIGVLATVVATALGTMIAFAM